MTSKRVTATDFSVFGETDNNGSLKLLQTPEAIENAFRAWLVSSRGEIIRRPDRGGYLKQQLSKPMNSDRLEVIRAAIMNGLEQDFIPYIEVESLILTPDYANRKLNIELRGISKEYKTKISTSATLRTG